MPNDGNGNRYGPQVLRPGPSCSFDHPMSALPSSRTKRDHAMAWRVTFQVLTAAVGGYVFTNAVAVFLVHALPMYRGDTVAIGYLLSFGFYTLAVMWVFARHSVLRGCGVLWLASLILAVLSWGLTVSGGTA